MRSSVNKIRKHRIYSDDFKKSLVASFEAGEFSVFQLEKLYGIRNITIYKWIYKFSNFNEKGCRIVEMNSPVKNTTSRVK